MEQTPQMAIDQLREANLYPWIKSYVERKTGIRGTLVNPLSFKVMIMAHPKFLHGKGWILHKDVGQNLIDSRSLRGTYGPGSLQIVFDWNTGEFWSDVDQFNPYQDTINLVGHLFLECIPDLYKAYNASNNTSNG